MNKENKTTDKAKKRVGRPSKHGDDPAQIHLRVASPLYKQIAAFRDSLEFRPEITDICLKAIEEFLEKRGFWPGESP